MTNGVMMLLLVHKAILRYMLGIANQFFPKQRSVMQSDANVNIKQMKDTNVQCSLSQC